MILLLLAAAAPIKSRAANPQSSDFNGAWLSGPLADNGSVGVSKLMTGFFLFLLCAAPAAGTVLALRGRTGLVSVRRDDRIGRKDEEIRRIDRAA